MELEKLPKLYLILYKDEGGHEEPVAAAECLKAAEYLIGKIKGDYQHGELKVELLPWMSWDTYVQRRFGKSAPDEIVANTK